MKYLVNSYSAKLGIVGAGLTLLAVGCVDYSEKVGTARQSSTCGGIHNQLPVSSKEIVWVKITDLDTGNPFAYVLAAGADVTPGRTNGLPLELHPGRETWFGVVDGSNRPALSSVNTIAWSSKTYDDNQNDRWLLATRMQEAGFIAYSGSAPVGHVCWDDEYPASFRSFATTVDGDEWYLGIKEMPGGNYDVAYGADHKKTNGLLPTIFVSGNVTLDATNARPVSAYDGHQMILMNVDWESWEAPENGGLVSPYGGI